MDQKGFANIALIVLIIIVVGGVIGYLVLTRTPTQQPPLSTDETAGWKTYRNEKYGFEFKYPNDLNIDNKFSTSNSLIFTPISPLSISFFIDDPITDPNGRTVTLDEYLLIYSYDVNYDSVQREINGLNWLSFVTKQRILDQNQNNGSIRYILQKNNIKYEFVYNGNIDSSNVKLFEQIVRTFAFNK